MIATAVKAPWEIVRLINSDTELMAAVSAFIESDLGENARHYVGPPSVEDIASLERADSAEKITLPGVALRFVKRRHAVAASGWEVEVFASEADIEEMRSWPHRYQLLAEWNMKRALRR